jgi:2-oxoisovalerate dehydrogenase E1 component alpha subunit
MLKNSRGLYVPEPATRPGDEASFCGIEIPAPGSVSFVEYDCKPADIRDYAFKLIRVLSDDHSAVGDWDPGLNPDQLVEGLRAMMMTRAYDNRMVRMQRQGKTSFYMKCTGEEAIAVAGAMALKRGDMCFPTYRQQGLLVARGWSLVDMMNQVYSNSQDRLRGRQMPVFYSSREAGFFSISGNLGTQYSQAVGWAMGAASDDSPNIAAAWIGEGATAEGDFHYALTFGAVYQAPVVFNIVNNQWAISSFAGIAGGDRTTFAARGLAYGIPSLRVDGNDYLAVYAVTAWAAQRARAGLGPTVIEHFTYRAEGHSTSDDPTKYRPNAAWPLGDPVDRLRQYMIRTNMWDDDRHAALINEIELIVREAGKEAESYGTLKEGDRIPVGTMFDDVFKELPPHLLAQRKLVAGY